MTKIITTNQPITRNKKTVEVYSEARNRMSLARAMESNTKEKRLNHILQHPNSISFEDYFNTYKRQDLAYAVIERPVKYTWKGNLTITNPNSETDTMQEAWQKLVDNFNLISTFRLADKLASIGNYSVILLGFNDVQNQIDLEKAVEKGFKEITYVKVYTQADAKIVEYDTNVNSKRYGEPLMYLIKTKVGASYTTLRVHYSRIIHVAGEILTSSVEGVPVLEKVYNRLLDVRKIVGGSAEMFWRGARPGYQGVVDDNYQVDSLLETSLKAKISDYENDLSRIILAEGFELKSLNTQVESPLNHVQVQIDLISSATAIPKRILVGSERGELSSAQDYSAWVDIIEDRRTNIAESQIIRPFIEVCKMYGILPNEDYIIEWEPLYTATEKEIAEISRIKSEALRSYVSSPIATEIIPPEAFLKMLMGFTAQEIDEILSMHKAEAFELPEELEGDETKLTEI